MNPVLDKKLEQIGIQAFLNDASVTEIAINTVGEIWVQTKEWAKIDAPNATLENLEQLVQLIANSNNIRLSNEQPIMSVQLPSGERVQICIPPATLMGNISVTIRRYSNETKSIEVLDKEGTFNSFEWLKHTNYEDEENIHNLNAIDKKLIELIQAQRIKEFLLYAVEQHKNIVIVGRTGSGKTFLTRSLIQEVPRRERIITIEDVHELYLPSHDNKVHLIFGSGKERTTAKQSLSACMRMKPDRIFLAEIRGDEAWDYICSLNTGHPGSITSAHANDALHAYRRLASLIKSTEVGATLDSAYIEHELFNTLHISIYYENRKMKQIFFDPIYSQTI
jgi:type IV secretion system protein VirB11